MKLFTKADDKMLFAQYAKGSDMESQKVVVKIYNPYGNGNWYIMNSDPQDPDYLWGIADLGYGAEVGSISRSELESYKNRFGLGFEKDSGFSPTNALEVYQGLRQGEYFENGGMFSESVLEEIDGGFTIKSFNKILNQLFPYSFGFKVFKPLNRQNMLTPNYDEAPSSLYGYEDKDINSKLYFPEYKRDHAINFSLEQGGENTYFSFLLGDEEGNEYLGTFGFKDRGDVDSSYVTGFISFLMECYKLPFKVKHGVYAEGGVILNDVKVNVYKSFHGLKAENYFDDVKGYDWNVVTMKRYSGELISTAKAGKTTKSADGTELFTYDWDAPTIKLISSKPSRVTEKVVEAQHSEALKVFKEKMDSDDYAKGGEIAKAEILGLRKNIMGTTSIEMKISGMRKSQEFSVYPISADDTDKIITIQSSTRIGRIDLKSGRGVMSQSHSSGAYSVHFQMDKLTPFTLNESDLEELKMHIFKTAGSSVGTRGIVSDNSGASRIMANGGNFNDDAKFDSFKNDLIKYSDYYELGDGYNSRYKGLKNKKGDVSSGQYLIEGNQINWSYVDKNGEEYSSLEIPEQIIDLRDSGFYFGKRNYADGGFLDSNVDEWGDVENFAFQMLRMAHKRGLITTEQYMSEDAWQTALEHSEDISEDDLEEIGSSDMGHYVRSLAKEINESNYANGGKVNWSEYYKSGGAVKNMPPRDASGERAIDKESIEKLTDYVNNLPQTKTLHIDDKTGDYKQSRKKLHVKIINEFKKDVVCITNGNPIAILMGGSPASGKSSFLKKYSPFLLKSEILKVDADEIRAKLPEYKGYNASQTHLETKDIVNTLISDKNIGIPCDFDLIYDGTMNSIKSYKPLVALLKNRGYKVFIVYMDNVPKETIVKRVLERYKKAGRFVPLEVVDDFFDKGKTAFNDLKNDVDGYMVVDGSSEDYKIIEKGGMSLPKTRKYSKLGEKITKEQLPNKYKDGGETLSKYEAIFSGKKISIEAATLWEAKTKAIQELKVPKSKIGYLAVYNVNDPMALSYSNGGKLPKGKVYLVEIKYKELEKDGGDRRQDMKEVLATSHKNAEKLAEEKWQEAWGSSDLTFISAKSLKILKEWVGTFRKDNRVGFAITYAEDKDRAIREIEMQRSRYGYDKGWVLEKVEQVSQSIKNTSKKPTSKTANN
jgi:predicted ABC-type ATPase